MLTAPLRVLLATSETSHLLRQGQRVQLHCLVQERLEHIRVPAVRDRRPDHEEEREARHTVPARGRQEGFQIW